MLVMDVSFRGHGDQLEEIFKISFFSYYCTFCFPFMLLIFLIPAPSLESTNHASVTNIRIGDVCY